LLFRHAYGGRQARWLGGDIAHHPGEAGAGTSATAAPLPIHALLRGLRLPSRALL